MLVQGDFKIYCNLTNQSRSKPSPVDNKNEVTSDFFIFHHHRKSMSVNPPFSKKKEKKKLELDFFFFHLTVDCFYLVII